MATYTQIITFLTVLINSYGQKWEFFFKQPKCCSEPQFPAYRREQSWVDTLREAAYQSVTRHLDYSGTLDGRLDRDHRLWRYLKQATFTVDGTGQANTADDLMTGVLVVQRPTEHRETGFAFHQKQNSAYECLRNECYTNNSSLLALWQVQRTENPYKLLIRVKFPKSNQSPIEDVYEYVLNRGIKRLNNDFNPFDSLENQGSHRFSLPIKYRGEFKGSDRIDDPFYNVNRVFGIGRVMPTSFLYDSNIPIGKTEDGWIIPSQQRPHPGFIVDTGIRGSSKGQSYNPVTGPFIAGGPQGFRHVIHSLPSIAPPQHLDKPVQDVRSFLPSVGPIRAPPPFKTDHAYKPGYVVYYNNDPHNPRPGPSNPSSLKPFKPSSEFVHYSELDPFFHPEVEDTIQAAPIPDFKIEKPPPNFPQSINDQLPNNLPSENPNAPFKIVVEDILRTTTRKPSITTTEKPKTQTPYLKTKEFESKQTNTQEDKMENIKPFGEKINPRNKTQTSTKNKQAFQTVTDEDSKSVKKNFEKIPANNYKSTKSRINFSNPPENLKEKKGDESFNVTQDIKDMETTEAFTDYTTEEIEETTFVNEEINTENQHITQKPDLILPKIKVLGLETTEGTSLQNITDYEKGIMNSTNKPTSYDYYTDETTETNNETTENEFLSAFTDYFSSDTTTADMAETTMTPKDKTKAKDRDEETQESKQNKVQYRLLTFPGDAVSIVANTISKSVSYRTSAGKEGKVKSKQPITNRQRHPD